MEIFINDQCRAVPEAISIKGLLNTLKMTQQKGFAVAINEQIIPHSCWDEQMLFAGDKVIIIHATAGG